MRKESAELRETPSPKHALGVNKTTQVADAEETHREPASSAQEEAARGRYADRFPLFQGIPGAIRSFLAVPRDILEHNYKPPLLLYPKEHPGRPRRSRKPLCSSSM